MIFKIRRPLAASIVRLGLGLGLGLVLVGCGSPKTPPVGTPMAGGYGATALPPGTSFGVVESIQPPQAATASGPSGVGAAVGSVLGTVLGYQIGGGVGRVASTAAGAAGGSLAGNRVEQNRMARNAGFRVGVRLDNGNLASVTQDNIGDLTIGNRVRIDDGRVNRY
jgi:outer membrane lipoprotein SlyB